MTRKVEISANDLGTAIVGHIARKCKGERSMSFVIQQSSMRIDADEPIWVTLSDEPIGFENATGKKGNNFFPGGRTITLSRKEALSAIVYEIAVYILEQPPERVLEVSLELPEKIRVRLMSVPKGASAQHCFDGSLSLVE